MSTGLSGKMYVKEVDADIAPLEVELQQISAKYGFSPSILKVHKNKKYWRIEMEDVDELCLADTYGEDPECIPEYIWDSIRAMLTILFEEEGIEYVDITPYNFIEKNGRIYVIDFGDAKYTNKFEEPNWFLTEFLDGKNSWNPDYK